MSNVSDSVAPRRGRPRKFARPSHAVTLTLPDEVIQALSAVDADLSRAVVRVTQPEIARRPHPAAELVVFGRRAVIVVTPSRTLEQLRGVVLIPLSDGRALISFDEPGTVAELELQLQDLLEEHKLPAADRQVLLEISRILREARRSDEVALMRRNIIVLETSGTARRSAAPAVHGRSSRRSHT